jgi:hypothetical protein
MNDTRVPLEEAAPGLSTEESAAEAQRVLLHMPVDIRSVSLALLAVLASLFALHWAKAVMVPILLGVMFSYALAPTVDLLQRWRLPRPIGAAVVSMGLVALMGWGVYSLADDADALIATLPEVAQKARRALLEKSSAKPSAIDKVQEAAKELEKVATGGTAPAARAPGAAAATAAPERRRHPLDQHARPDRLCRPGRGGVLHHPVPARLGRHLPAQDGQAGRAAAEPEEGHRAGARRDQRPHPALPLRAAGDERRRRRRHRAGLPFHRPQPRRGVGHRRRSHQPHPLPRRGDRRVGASIVGFMQFDAIDMGLYVGAVSFAIHAVVGNVLTPWWTGRSSRMNPFGVFVGVLAFGWLWGVWGLLLGTPILMAVKTICDRIDSLKPIGEFLGA